MDDEYIKRNDLFVLSRDYIRLDGEWEKAVPIRAIRNIPSADVAPIKRGEWVENSRTSISERHRQIHYSIYKCSRCNHANGRFKSNFCPNCGARMDGE